MKALVIVDMLKDFVDGKLENPKAQGIIEPLQRLLAHARENFPEPIAVPPDLRPEAWQRAVNRGIEANRNARLARSAPG